MSSGLFVNREALDGCATPAESQKLPLALAFRDDAVAAAYQIAWEQASSHTRETVGERLSPFALRKPRKPIRVRKRNHGMTVSHPGQRVAVLADAQNLYHTARSLYTRNIDYSELLKAAVDGRELTRAIAYVIRADSPEEESFFEALTDIGFETRIKDIKTFKDGSQKADWDVGMSLDAVTLAKHNDAIVLCTGDGDFARVCRYVRHEGCRIEAMGFEESSSEDLKSAVDGFVDLSSDPDRFLL